MAHPDHREQLARDALKLWQGEPASLEFVGVSENYVCRFMKSGRRLYLRLTPSFHRTRMQIEAELDFIRYLHRGDVSVSLPVISVNGRDVEIVEDGNESFFACAFEEAAGERFFFSSDEADRKHFRLRGRTLGRIHALSKSYPLSEERRRFQWDEDILFRRIKDFLPESEKAAWTEYRRLMEYLSGLPKSEESFGLIHGDFGVTNLRCQNNLVTVFDFDDCCYHWYVYDLAITIYPHGWRAGAKGLLEALLEGYAEETAPGDGGQDEILNFCRLRLLYMFLNYAKKWGFSNLSGEQKKWLSQKRDNMAYGYVLRA